MGYKDDDDDDEEEEEDGEDDHECGSTPSGDDC